MKLKIAAFMFSFLYVLTAVNAQNIITDRPDFTESAVVVSGKTLQIESGLEYVDYKTSEELSYPKALARIGLGQNLEVRLGILGWTNVTIDNKSENYFNDFILEAKYQITDTDAKIPVSVLLVSKLPTGDEEVSSNEAEVGLKIATAFSINDFIGLGINVGAISVDNAGNREILSLASASMGIGIVDKLSAFIETYVNVPQNDVWMPILDFGFTYLINSDIQLDLYAGKGLNDYTPDFFIGAGFSFRSGF